MIARARRFMLRLLAPWSRRAAEEGLAREVAAHLLLLADDFERRGMTPDEAQAAARRTFGGVEQAKERQRDARGFRWIEDLRRDLHYACRGVLRRPLFALTAIVTLAVGIGLNTVVFTVADATLNRGFPLVADNDRLTYITSGVGCCVSVPDFDDWQAHARAFDGMALVRGVATTLAVGEGYPERVDVTEVTAGTFALVGQRPLLGRGFDESDEQPGAPAIAVVRYETWERLFGKDGAILGRVVRLDGTPTTIVGVMPPGFSFPQNQDFWVPLARTPEALRRDNRNTWFVLGRLRDGVSIDEARTEMAGIGRRLGDAYPLTNRGRNLTPYVEDFEGFFIGQRAATTYRVMLAAVALVLLIACANVANLLLARTQERSRELSLRMAIGAGRSGIVRQVFAESLMIATLGAAVGWVLARGGVQLYRVAAAGAGTSDQTLGTWFDNVLDYPMDDRVFAFLAVAAALSALLFGLAPALRSARLDLSAVLNEAGRSGSAPSRRFAHVLVAGQVALALVLLGGATGMAKSFMAGLRSSASFTAGGITVGRLELPATRYTDGEARLRLTEELRERLGAMPSIQSVAFSSTLPATRAGAGVRRPVEREAAPLAPLNERPTALVQTISPGYFSLLGVSLERGRDFLGSDRDRGGQVAIVSRALAMREWGGDAVGQRLRVPGQTGHGEWLTVVGVAPDLLTSREQPPDPVLYVPHGSTTPASMWLLVETQRVDAATVLRDAVRAIDRELPFVDGPTPLEARLTGPSRYRAVMAGLFGLFGLIALQLACVGLYAVLAQMVQARTREIGVRTVLGASPLGILRLVFSDTLTAVAVGSAAGLVAWFVAARALGALVPEWSPQPSDALIALAALAAAAMSGCLVPARRALAIEPNQALRLE